jgi:tellurite resistance protein TerC
MLATANISATHWTVFVVAVIVFLALDLGVFHRKAHVVRFREAFVWTSVWFVTAMAFGILIAPAVVPDWQRQQSIEFVTGYIIELSLSMDNVFVIAVIFTYFRVQQQFQHRVLFWGILGALLMRGLMIWAGVELIQHINWMFYVLGAFLVFTGIKMMFKRDEEVHPERNLAIRLAQKIFPVSPQFDGQNFTTILAGRRALTPMALVLLMVETTDLIFAMDSIPAIFAVTLDPFIVFTSNVFAILGLRSLYFVLAGAIDYFRYLQAGLSIVLVFIGAKMLLMKTQIHISTMLSLVIVGSIILVSILASVLAARYGHKRPESNIETTNGRE